MKYFLFLLLLVVVIISAGCTNSGSTNANTQITTQLTPNATIPTPSLMSSPITTPPITAVATINETPMIIPPYLTDVSKITFTHYNDDDFSVDYPSDWNVSKWVYTPYYCLNNVNPRSQNYTICYQNETENIGPFDYYSPYSDNNYQKTPRVVTFTSPDGSLKFSSFTNDFA